MRKNGHIPLEGERHLSQESAELLLRLSMGKGFKGPFCRQLTATHAAGVAVGRFAAGRLENRLGLLYDHADLCLGEARLERLYLMAQLLQHHDLLKDLLALAFLLCPRELQEHIVDERRSEDVDTRDASQELEEIRMQFRTLFVKLRDLDNDVVYKMASCISTSAIANEREDKDYKDVLKPLLKEGVKHLKAIRECLSRILTILSVLKHEAQEDWRQDCRQLKKACNVC